jgi:hypothetical protein
MASLRAAPQTKSTSSLRQASKTVLTEYPLRMEGTARLYTCNLPMDTFVDFSDPKDHQSYTYCWIDGERGRGGHISFPTPGTSGVFKLDINLRQGDPDLLKTQVSMHMRDQNTNNFRTVTLAVSAVDLSKLLAGETDRVVMYDQFVPGNFCDLSIRATNASDYANFQAATAVSASTTKPLLQLRPSSLRNLKIINDQVKSVSDQFVDAMGRFNVAMAKGGEPFYRGVTRCPPAPVLFFSLMLGTPAYALFPLSQPGVRGQKGSTDQYRAHPPALVPLCHHECTGGVSGTLHPSGTRGIPCLPQDSPHGSDGRVHTEAGRYSFWSIFRSGPSHYLRRWTRPLPAGHSARARVLT